jgi:hypothetical protein
MPRPHLVHLDSLSASLFLLLSLTNLAAPYLLLSYLLQAPPHPLISFHSASLVNPSTVLERLCLIYLWSVEVVNSVQAPAPAHCRPVQPPPPPKH